MQQPWQRIPSAEQQAMQVAQKLPHADPGGSFQGRKRLLVWHPHMGMLA